MVFATYDCIIKFIIIIKYWVADLNLLLIFAFYKMNNLYYLSHYRNYYNDLYLSSIHNVDQLKVYRQNQLIVFSGKFVARFGIDGNNTELFKINDTQISSDNTLY